MILKRYDTWNDYISWAKSPTVLAGKYAMERVESRPDWYGGLSFDHAVELMQTGDDSTVVQAEKLLARIQDFTEGLEIRDWQPSPFGAFPIVPEYLAGKPDCMRRIAPTGDVSPISLYVGMTPELNVNPDELLKRGCAILALVLKLQAIRPVDLKIVTDLGTNTGQGDCVEVVPIDSKPVSIAHAAYALTSIGFVRRVMFGSANVLNGFTGPFSSLYHKHNEHSFQGPKYIQEMRTVLGLDEQDVFIPGTRKTDLAITDPIAWVNQNIERYNQEAK